MNTKFNFNVDDEVFFKRDLNLIGQGVQSIFVPKNTTAKIVQVVNEQYVKIKIEGIIFTIDNEILGMNWD